jgi:hypothetical protein
MHIYSDGGSPSSHHRQNSKDRRRPIDWGKLRERIAREHRLIAGANPRSPRVRPSLAHGGAR